MHLSHARDTAVESAITRTARPIIILLLAALSLLLGGEPARADTKALAALAFRAAADPSGWLEGFAIAREGRTVRYPCHRTETAVARITTASDGTSRIAWETGDVPAEWHREEALFLWIFGLDTSQPGKHFELFVDGERRFRFANQTQQRWQVEGLEGGALDFTCLRSDPDENYGYLVMTAPAEWLTSGKPLELALVGEAANSEAWTAVFEYPDALSYLREHETRAVYDSTSLIHYGTAQTDLIAAPHWAGRSIALGSGEAVLGEHVLTRDGDVSVATIDVALEEQPALRDDAWIAVDGTRIASVEMPDFQRMRLRGFLDEQLRFSRYVFPPGDFPSLDWERPAMIHNQMGPLELGVTFYDAEMNPVEAAERPGRYGAVAEATGPDGYTVRRYITLYCCPEEWQEEQIDVSPERVEPLGISGELWAEHRTAIADFLGAQLTRSLGDARESAVFWAGLSELPASLPSGSFEADPWHRDRQWWVTFKRRQSGADLKYPAIDRPLRRGVTRGHVLTEGDPAAVGYQEEHLAAIRRACEDWVQAAAEPMAILVARRGTIVLHEAFGVRDDGEPMSVTTPTWMASITKLLTGCLMMQLVDEGLVCLDDPVADYLPEFERRAVTPVTVRHLFTHTSGLHAADWRGDHDMNPSLENMMGHYLPYIRAAEEQRYTGAGYAVAGKLMERVVGLAVPHLSQRLLLGPLGCTDTQVAGTGGDCMSTCLDMARVGQMLLNRGSYGEHEFFSESTFAQMLPVPVSELVPGMERGEWGATHWGIGLMSAGGTVLSDEAFTHAAASGAILIVDPPRDLVLVCCRNRKGPQYSEFNRRLVEVCVAPVAGVDRQ